MIDKFDSSRKCATVLRLVSLPASIREMLLEMDVDSEELNSTIEDLNDQRFLPSVQSVDEICNSSFLPRDDEETPFPKSRFGDGSIGIYYSAFDRATCHSEIAHRILSDYDEPSADFRYYLLVKCSYDGSTVDLRGKEKQYPQLISPTSDGYPFCQGLAKLGGREQNRWIFHAISKTPRRNFCTNLQ